MVNHTSIVVASPTVTLTEHVQSDDMALLLLPMAIVAVSKYSKKQLRKLKRKMFVHFLKKQLKSMFSFRKRYDKASNFKLLLILLGLGFVVAIGIFLSWTIALTFFVVGGLVALVFSGKD